MTLKNDASKKQIVSKKLFIPAKYTEKIIIPDSIIHKLPAKIVLFSSVQFLDQLKDVKKQLVQKNKKILSIKSKNFLYGGVICDEGQLLGCNLEVFDKKVNHKFDELNQKFDDFYAFMYVGDGTFHPKALLIKNRKDIYCYNPKSQKLEIIKKELHDEYEKKKKGAILKFLSSKNIGIIITKKPGQENIKRAEKLKQNIIKKWPNKKVYLLISDEINFNELENFNFIDIYVNTACPRIAYDDSIRTEKKLINLEDAEELII